LKSKTIAGLSFIFFMIAGFIEYLEGNLQGVLLGSILALMMMVAFCTELILEEMRKQKGGIVNAK